MTAFSAEKPGKKRWVKTSASINKQLYCDECGDEIGECDGCSSSFEDYQDIYCFGEHNKCGDEHFCLDCTREEGEGG